MAESIQRPGGHRTPGWASALLALMLFGAWPARPAAHDIPASVTVQAFAKPEGRTLRFLLRVPLVSMRDFTLPSSDGVFLDLARVEAVLGDMARTWLVTSVTMFEEDRPLGPPRLAAARISLPSDSSFGSYHAALSHLGDAPLAPGTSVAVTDAQFDVMFEYAIESDRSRFSNCGSRSRLGVHVCAGIREHALGRPLFREQR